MFLHIGGDYTIHTKNIIAIMDLDTSTVSKISREFLENIQKENKVINVSDDLPKSYVICEEKGETTVYISPISSSTLLKRKNNDTF